MKTNWMKARVCVLALGLGLGCGDDASAVDGPETDTEATETEASGDGPSSSASSSSTDETGGVLEAHAEVQHFATQPMVVDVTVSANEPLASVTLQHTSDPGVVVSSEPSDEPTVRRFRVRGLAPDTEHTLEWVATAEDGDVAQDVLTFHTGAPLPGFLPTVEVEQAPDRTPENVYRLVDMAPFPFGDAAGVFMLDNSGVTRWYMGGLNTVQGPEAIWAAAKLLDDGSVLYLQGHTIIIIDELGNRTLELSAKDLGLPGMHHEILELPDGNLLVLSFSYRDVDYPVEGTQHVAGDIIVELTREGDIVWTWDTFDHLDPLRTRAGFELPILDPDTGQESRDWTHANGIEVSPDQKSLLVSLRHQDWILKIDRESGDLIWRLGEEGDFSLVGGGPWFYHQHSPQIQPDGSLLLYDNAIENPNLPPAQWHSRAVRYELDEDAMEATLVWQDDGEQINVPIAGDADLLPAGHYQVLDSTIVEGMSFSARLREIDPQASPMLVWALFSPPDYLAYRATAHARLVGQAR